MDDATRRARQLIEATYHMTLATADAAGKPWGTPVFFAHDEAFTLYWVSYVEAIHSRNIRVRPEVSITILGEPPDYVGDGVYFDAIAAELNDAGEIERAIEARRTRPQVERFMVNSPADVLDDAAWRMYKAVPLAIYKRADIDDVINGQCITARVKVTL